MSTLQEGMTKVATMLREMADRVESGEIGAIAFSGYNGIIEVPAEGMMRKYEATGIQAHVIVTGTAEGDQQLVIAKRNAIDVRAADVMKPLALA